MSLALSALALIVACNDIDEVAADADVDSTSEECSVSFISSIESRVVDNEFQTNDLIYVETYNATSEYCKESLFSYDAGVFSPKTADDAIIKYASEEYSYYAIYPAYNADGQLHSNVLSSFPFSAQTNQSTLESVNLSQLMSSSVTESSDTQPKLKFTNLMSKVSLSVMVDFNSITSSEFTATYSLKVDALVNPKVGASLVSQTAEYVEITPYVNNDSYEAIVAPQVVAPGTTIATIIYDGQNYDWIVEAESMLETNSVYEYTAFIDSESNSVVFINESEVETYIALYGGDGENVTAACSFVTKSANIGNTKGDDATLNFMTNMSVVSATVETGVDWLTAAASVVGTAGTVTFTAAEDNTLWESRTAEVVVTVGEGDNTASQSITVTQASGMVAVGDVVEDSETGTYGIIYYVSSTEIHMLSVKGSDPVQFATISPVEDTAIDIRVNNNDAAKAAGGAGLYYEAFTSSENFALGCYPAYTWVVALGEGWYLPNLGDMEIISTNLGLSDDAVANAYSAKMVDAGGVAFDMGTGSNSTPYYWLTNINSGGTNAYYYNLSTGDNTLKSISSTYYVRGVKYISL